MDEFDLDLKIGTKDNIDTKQAHFPTYPPQCAATGYTYCDCPVSANPCTSFC